MNAHDRPLPVAQKVCRAGTGTAIAGVCSLDYAGRFLRRKRLTTGGGLTFLVDLPQTTSLDDGDRLELDDGRHVAIEAAPEALLRVTGPDLARLAWHIGNRHTPCQIAAAALLIQDDPVMAHMLRHLGASVTAIAAPFTPEGGAYGHGRTHAHSHGATAHEH